MARKEPTKRDLLERKNVVAVGRGYKVSGGEIVTDEAGNPVEAVVVSVKEKQSFRSLKTKDRVPPSIDGKLTDVVEVGEVSILQDVNPQERHRPIVPGLSLGLNPGVTAGTLGFFVANLDSPDVPLILSNWHVIAADNTPIEDRDVLTITQPGNYDGGTVSSDVVAHLMDFVPISVGGLPIPSECPVAPKVAAVPNFFAKLVGSRTRLVPVYKTMVEQANLVDAALGLLDVSVEFVDSTPHIGTVNKTAAPELGMKVHKFGRTTSYTTGTITQVDLTVNVQGYPGGIATFEDQVAITGDGGGFLAGGDSGSGLVSEDGEAVGLCFAGSDTIGIANTWPNVESALGIKLWSA